MIVGAVYGAGSLIYKKEMKPEEYIRELGGVTPYADEERIHVVKPNGLVEPYGQRTNQIVPGDIIVVPSKLEGYFVSSESRLF